MSRRAPPARYSPESISGPLLAWYRSEKRALPWRQHADPYRVWVSEMMLQQTQVTTVVSYYERWLRRFPNLRALARATEDDVLSGWQGLGYYARARRLLRGAQLVVRDHGAELPRDPEALRKLPGIGPYTASAIASIAYGAAVPVVDGNVERVLSRLFAVRGDVRAQPHKRRILSLAASLVPPDHPGDYNQALMELGATTCTPRTPNCPGCPLSQKCAAKQLGRQDQFPARRIRAKPDNAIVLSAFIRRGSRSLLVKLPSDARRWAGMWMFPSTEIETKAPRKADLVSAVKHLSGLSVRPLSNAGLVKHSVTRYRVALKAYDCVLISGRARPLGAAQVAWKKPEELTTLAMPAAHRRLSQLFLQRQRP